MSKQSPGVSIFICGRKRHDCATAGCTRRAVTQCTYPVKRNGVEGHCDRHQCAECATSVPGGVHCRPHARLKATERAPASSKRTELDRNDPRVRPDWAKHCASCGEAPIVPLTGMCGPCTFGEAETAGGKW